VTAAWEGRPAAVNATGCQRRPAGGGAAGERYRFGSDHVKDVQQDDDRDRDPDEPKKNATHVSDPIGCCRSVAINASGRD